MEDKELKPLDSQTSIKIRFSPEEEKDCYIKLRSKLIKLLYLIEDEQAGKTTADLWFYGFMYELASANSLCHERLTQVVVKIHGLFEDFQYKTMTHAQIKCQTMESKGILDHLIKEVDNPEKSDK